MLQTVNEDQMDQMRAAGALLADELNAALREFRDSGVLPVALFLHAPASYGAQNCADLRDWAPGAAEAWRQKVLADERCKFRVGGMGSVWFDVEIEAELRGKMLKRKVRVFGAGSGQIGLDATFRETFHDV